MDAVTHLAAGKGGNPALKQSLQHLTYVLLLTNLIWLSADLGQMQLAEQLQFNCRLPLPSMECRSIANTF
jgi:hypothetical protein